MVTMVGTQDSFDKALASLLELEYDALEAYEIVVKHVSQQYQSKLTEFISDHRRHISELTRLLTAHNYSDIPKGPSLAKQWLTKGKVALASLIGDRTIFTAMHSNEEDTNTAYERMLSHRDKSADANEVLTQGLADERKHKAWLEQTIDALA